MDNVIIKEKLSTKSVRFESVVEKAMAIAEKREDHVVKDVAHNLWMNDDGTLSFIPKKNNPAINMKPTGWALTQISMKLGMPTGYAEKCIVNHHADLAAENINTWLSEQNGGKRKKTTDYFVRTYDGGIDGILSHPHYTVFDTPSILASVANAIDVDDYHIVGSYLSDERMHLRMIRDEMLQIDGEDLYPGIFIDSSDVGRTALKISFGIWKKVCTNGLCINKLGGTLYHQRHVGITALDVEEEIIQRLESIPTLIENSKNIITAASSDRIDLTNEDTFNAMMADVRKLSKISEAEAKETLEIAQTKYSMTRWGIVNAMTEIAQKFELDERLRIENAAGMFITA